MHVLQFEMYFINVLFSEQFNDNIFSIFIVSYVILAEIQLCIITTF